MQKTNVDAVKGFTLVELLIVIAIVAILSVVVILTLNPAQLLAQARDSNRISDLNTLKAALSLYLADGKTFDGSGSNVVTANCYTYASPAPGTACSGNGVTRHAGKTTTNSTSLSANGTGWIPVNFAAISSGAPFGALPRDPLSNANYFYSFVGDRTANTFEVNADMESTKFGNGGAEDVENTDGGNVSSTYEVGTVPGLTF